jgi:hypothetical protein
MLKKLGQCQFSDSHDQARPQDRQLGSKPSAAERYLLSGWHAVSTVNIFPGKASADRTHVDRLPELLLIDVEFFFEPFEHRFPGGPSKWAPKLGLLCPGCLADQHYPA